MLESSQKSVLPQPEVSQPVSPDRWVGEYGDILFRYALTKVSQVPLAEDLVQETFLAAWKGRQNYAGDASFLTWLTSILRRKIVDEYRRQGRANLGDPSHNPEPTEEFTRRGHWQHPIGHWPDDPQKLLENREFWEALDRCAKKLPPNLASVFQLREIEQTNTTTICKRLEISMANVSVRLYRARALLRRCLESTWFSGEEVEHGETTS
jgi:RNA polymerase sigma-70 factor (ECF subfamily)